MSPSVKEFKNRSSFMKVMNKYRVARFYGPQCIWRIKEILWW